MILEAPENKNVIVQHPGEMHGQSLHNLIQSDSAQLAIMPAWMVILMAALAWICWWHVRSSRYRRHV